MMAYFLVLDMKDIVPHTDEVDKSAEEYLDLAASIKKRGILEPIHVRPVNGGFQIIQGNYRHSAALDAGHKTIPSIILNMNDTEVEEFQMVFSVHRIVTKSLDYRMALLRLITRDSTITIGDLSKRLSKNPKWIISILCGKKLGVAATRLALADKIVAANVYVLAKLPVEEQVYFFDKAIKIHPIEFPAIINRRLKELKDAKRKVCSTLKNT